MGLDPSVAAAGLNVLDTGANIAAAASANKATRKWNEKIYHWQRQDALADWTMQNEYNSPQSQMQRLREGGLNPNLVYGNGATATSSSQPRSSSPGSYNPKVPQIATSQGLTAVMQTKMQQAQIDNLKAQNTVIEQDRLNRMADTLLKYSQVDKTNLDSDMQRFDLNLKGQLMPTTLEAAKLGVDKQRADITYTLDQNDRAAMQNAVSVRQAVESILTSRLQRAKTSQEIEEIKARIKNLGQDSELKQFDIELEKKGIRPHDNIIPRMAAEYLSGLPGSLKSGMKSLSSQIDSNMNPIGRMAHDVKEKTKLWLKH